MGWMTIYIIEPHFYPIWSPSPPAGLGLQRGGLFPQRAQGGRLPAGPLPRWRTPLERRRRVRSSWRMAGIWK